MQITYQQWASKGSDGICKEIQILAKKALKPKLTCTKVIKKLKCRSAYDTNPDGSSRINSQYPQKHSVCRFPENNSIYLGGTSANTTKDFIRGRLLTGQANHQIITQLRMHFSF